MKKLCEKHSLLVGALITLFIAIILSWIFPEAYYSNGKLGLSYAEKFGLFASTANDTRVGLFDITTYGQLVIYYFTTILTNFLGTATTLTIVLPSTSAFIFSSSIATFSISSLEILAATLNFPLTFPFI